MKHSCVALAIACALAPLPAWAGRPLATDDAGVADTGTCQLESWADHSDNDRALVIAPACGVYEGIEIGADYTLLRPRDEMRARGGLAVKWVPEAWKVETPAGALSFGLKLGTSSERPAAAGWYRSETGALALATLTPNDAWTLHSNLGAAHNRATGTTAALLNLALVWTPRDDALLFVENQANTRRGVFGGTLNTVGGRYWPVTDRFGIDVTASRQTGAGLGTLWTLGFGWYGLSL